MSSSELHVVRQMYEEVGRRLKALEEAEMVVTPDRREFLVKEVMLKAKIGMLTATKYGGDGQHARGTWIVGQSTVMPAIRQEYPGLVYYPSEGAAWAAYRHFDKKHWIKKD